jgi:hypothetical protein
VEGPSGIYTGMMIMRRLGLGFAVAIGIALGACGEQPGDGASIVDRISNAIVGGQEASQCMWPTCLQAGGCTNTLVHPRLVISAGHCLGGASTMGVGSASFGEGSPFARTVMKTKCVRHPNFVYNANVDPHDVSYCILANEVTDVPIVPVLSACEADEMMKPGQPITLVGFGELSPGAMGTPANMRNKRWVNTTIASLRLGGHEVVVGTMSAGSAAGDSGGPAYVQMPDKTWRVFGITSRPANGNANAMGIYTVMSRYIDWIEKDSGIDITPCHDSAGAWVGGPACDKFPTDPGGMSGGTWANGCSAGPVATPAPTCGGGQPGGAGTTSPDSGVGSGRQTRHWSLGPRSTRPSSRPADPRETQEPRARGTPPRWGHRLPPRMAAG